MDQSAPGIDDGAWQMWRAFMRAHSMMLRRIARDLEEEGLPPLAWYDVLAALRDAPADHRMKQVELAERVLISNSGLSRLLDRIEAKGLLERVQCPGDRRSLHVQLTPAGAEMLERMWPVYARGIADDFLPALGSNPEEIGRALEEIGNTCDAHRAEAAEADAAESASR